MDFSNMCNIFSSGSDLTTTNVCQFVHGQIVKHYTIDYKIDYRIVYSIE